MKLRQYCESDAEALASLFTESIHTLAVHDYDAEQRDAWAPRPPNIGEWRQRLGSLTTVVAQEDATCLGFISYETDGHVDLLYTAPGSARRGVATALLAAATTQLQALGITELFTEASLVAAPFFARQGFEVTEEQNVERRGVRFRRFAMRKRLQ